MLDELRKQVTSLLTLAGVDASKLEDLLEAPKRPGHGHLALPVFVMAKEKKKAPPLVAQELAAQLNPLAGQFAIEKVEAVAGFVNFQFSPQAVQKLIVATMQNSKDGFVSSARGKGRTMVIDFSSPNVAKPMHVGHLRATVIGQSIVNLAKAQGYKVIGLNHLGDWGVQFGNLAWAYQNWGSEYPFNEQPFESLFQLYVRFHQAAETDTDLARKGAETFLKLESGDPEITKIWKMVVEISLKEYSKLWALLGVQHELVRGESFYNDRLKQVEQLLEDKGLLIESDGAMVVRLDDEGMAPCLIRKTDGASLYATRDLASAIYRRDELKADLNLYVVGAEQTLHFRQVFAVLKKMGYAWWNICHHISFGMYRFKDIGKMSSRKGNVILLEDVLSKAIAMVKEIIEQKNPELQDKESVAQQVGVGAIVFNDLMNDRVKNVEFDWDRILDFEGDSGPYVQYCAVRCQSLIKKFNRPIAKQMSANLDTPEEIELMRAMLAFPDTVSTAFEHFKPHLVATHLLEICRLFNQFYSKHRILADQGERVESRMVLVSATQQVLSQGLGLLNIQVPEAM